MTKLMNAMKGMTLRMTWSTLSRPDWYRVPTTVPAPRPTTTKLFVTPDIMVNVPPCSAPRRLGFAFRGSRLRARRGLRFRLQALTPARTSHEEGRDPLGHDAADEDDDQADQRVTHRELRERQAKLRDTRGDPGPDEDLARIDVREQSERRVHIGDRRIVESRLVLLREPASLGVGHRVGEKENRQHRRNEVAKRVVLQAGPRGHLHHAVDPFRPDQPGQRIDGGHQDDQQRHDTDDETTEDRGAFLKDPDEMGREPYENVHCYPPLGVVRSEVRRQVAETARVFTSLHEFVRRLD